VLLLLVVVRTPPRSGRLLLGAGLERRLMRHAAWRLRRGELFACVVIVTAVCRVVSSFSSVRRPPRKNRPGAAVLERLQKRF